MTNKEIIQISKSKPKKSQSCVPLREQKRCWMTVNHRKTGGGFRERNGPKEIKWNKIIEIQDVARKERGRGNMKEGEDFSTKDNREEKLCLEKGEMGENFSSFVILFGNCPQKHLRQNVAGILR